MSNRLFKHFPMFILIFNFLMADVFMTELTDPQNSSTSGRYVELYNNGDSSVDLSDGWTIQRWTNGNDDPTASSIVSLTGTISAGGFYIICNDFFIIVFPLINNSVHNPGFFNFIGPDLH